MLISMQNLAEPIRRWGAKYAQAEGAAQAGPVEKQLVLGHPHPNMRSL
jgi:hypothetical protein